MEYFVPGPGLNVGDCMPFAHEGQFHLYYLLDRDHHRALDGRGGHQWAHRSTRDLVHWQEHPLALPIEHDWEASICTGSVFFHEGTFHAFYAVRKPDWTQHLGHATSTDGIHFKKIDPNPFASAPKGYNPADFRDPFIIRENGNFHMIVTSGVHGHPMKRHGGCLLRYTSRDLFDWKLAGPFLAPVERDNAPPPECPDYFSWNGWHYLLFSQNLATHYRMSREPMGPWTRPAVDTLDNPWNCAIKTAPFGKRRIAAGWLAQRLDQKDKGQFLWGGNLVLRELVQHPDGTLGTKFVPEIDTRGERITRDPSPLTRAGVDRKRGATLLTANDGRTAATIADLPRSYRLTCSVTARPNTAALGLVVRSNPDCDGGYWLRVDLHRRTLSLADQTVPLSEHVGWTEFRLAVIVRPDLVDVCIDDRQCVIARCFEERGSHLHLFCDDGAITIQDLSITRLQG